MLPSSCEDTMTDTLGNTVREPREPRNTRNTLRTYFQHFRSVALYSAADTAEVVTALL